MGNCSNGEDEKNTSLTNDESGDCTGNSRMIYFINQDGKVTPSPVLQYVLDSHQPFDTVISCEDGKIGAHRLVLTTASPFIGDMFNSHDHRLGEVAVLVLPDVRVQIMKFLLNFCYTGTMYFPVEDEKEVFETMKFLLFGEFANLSLREVTVKLPSEAPATPDDNTESGQAEMGEQPGTSASSDGASASFDANQDSLMDLLSSSDDEETPPENEVSTDESDDDDDEEEGERTAQERILPDEQQERLKFANTFLKYKKLEKEETSGEESSINYIIIPPRPAGCKTKKLQCYHCPGAFKSMETLAAHLEDNHGILLQSRNLNKSEFDTLTHCGVCKTEHSQIASANHCISKRSKTRCYICLEIVRLREFEEHIKESHGIEQRNGMGIVKCRWCDAGILLQHPIDNKSMSAHCFGSHFPGGRNGKAVVEKDKEEKEKQPQLKSQKMEPNQQSTQIKPQQTTDHFDFVRPSLPSCASTPPPPTPPLVLRPNNPASSSSASSAPRPIKTLSSSSNTTPKAGTSASSSIYKGKAVPAVLALFQKVTQKRKLMQEAESESEQHVNDHDHHVSRDKPTENPKKRARLDANGNRLQVAKRSGKPLGRQVDVSCLKSGVPAHSSTQRNKKGKMKSVMMNVTKLANIYVNFNYSKTFVLDHLKKKYEENYGSPQIFKKDRCTSLDEFGANKRQSDFRCSLPCF